MLVAIVILLFFSVLYFALWICLIAIVIFDVHKHLFRLSIPAEKIISLQLSTFESFWIAIQTFFSKRIRPFWPEIVAIICFVLGILTIFFGQKQLYEEGIIFTDAVRDFYANSATELISIAFTVFILDRAYRRKREHEEKQRIIRQLGSQSNAFALDAVHQARVLYLLTDGSIQSQSFKGADLTKANFQEAKLEDINLCDAILKHSIFVDAHLSRSQLNNSNLSSADLRNANLTSAKLQKANLQEASCHNTVFIEANLSDATFIKASLVGADFTAAILDRLDLTEADLTNAILKKANLQSILSLTSVTLDGTDLSEADLRGVDLEEVKIIFKPNLQRGIYDSMTRFPSTFDQTKCGALGPGAQLEGTDLSNLEWLSADLTNANLRRANLTNSILPESILYGTDLRDAILENTSFTLAKYDESTQWPETFDYTRISAIGPESYLPHYDLSNQDLTEVNLSDAFLYKGNLKDTNLSDAILTRANLQLADLTRAELPNADLSLADLRNTNLSSAYLHNAIFRSSKLQGTNFENATELESADFHQASYDSETVWPVGFDPQSAGAVFVPRDTTA